MGDKNDENKTFSWFTVRLNLPLTENYNLSKPWVSKVQKYGNISK